jgi:dipeptidyl aminopeptidase/acylaminoacyl peptidase
VSLNRLSEPALSPNGQWVSYSVSSYNASTNENSISIQVLEMANHSTRILVSGSTLGNAIWVSDTILLFLNTQNGLTEIYSMDIHSSRTVRKVSQFPISVANLKVNVKEKVLIFTATVYANGTMEDARLKMKEEEAEFHSGKVYDQLFVRHWDQYVHPGRRSQLFAVKYELQGSQVVLLENPWNVMAETALETPVRLFLTKD